MKLEVTFPAHDDGGGRYVEARYDGFVVRLGGHHAGGVGEKPWWEGGEPEAFDLFLLSIGLCTGATILAFIAHRDISGDDVAVTLATQGTPDGLKVTKVTTTVHLAERFPEKYRKAIGRAAEACAVRKHMEDPPEFVTEVKVG